ncbi:hypothetical protein DICSQDRAFT_125832 [Dichomitus squalens LYAD-421 SS1]|uniref:uncharacterized protein n=1 Tax=Dichomitus squalens (strain LYAD-421) TaxID=732165 RepID=UPI0004414514|nr:uncharacterized protein DICSQDRAFT_125832 [Dichomitus squalens LYAD-421 SS1]EJF63352.1 hypothetical protein DICSQDRAFT_125832 [Dichomitus squalens LYAD-421 SS1]
MMVEMSAVQKVGVKKEPGVRGDDSGTADDTSESEFEEEEERINKAVLAAPVKYRKVVEEHLRAWIEAGGCRRDVADAYFDNPPRCPISPSLCCDNCAAAASLSTVPLPASASTTPSGPMVASATAPPPPAMDVATADHHLNPALDEDEDEGGSGIRQQTAAPHISSPTRSVDNPLRSRMSPKRRAGTHLKTVKTQLVDWRYTTRRTKYKFSSLKAENLLPDTALTTIASLRRDLKTIHDLKRVLNPPWPHVDAMGRRSSRLSEN